MPHVLLIEETPQAMQAVGVRLREAGHDVHTLSSRSEALTFLSQQPVEVVVTEASLRETWSLDVLRTVCSGGAPARMVIAGVGDARRDVERELLALAGSAPDASPRGPRTARPHAAARWARAVVPIVDSPTDPRTIADWSRWIATSPGALRTWCSTAGIGPRRSLVFGRILRAVVMSEGGRHKPENLLDVVDRRTLAGLVTLSGLDACDFPRDIDAFLDRQTLVHDPDAVGEVRRALGALQLAIPRADRA